MDQGQIFDSNDILEMATPGLSSEYGLSWFLGNRGGLTCDPEEVLLHMVGAGGQIVTVFPRKRLVLAKSGFFLITRLNLYDGFWNRLFEGVDCEC